MNIRNLDGSVSVMTLIASLIFMIGLYVAITVIIMTLRNAIPRIRQILDMEFGPEVLPERRIITGEMRRSAPAHEIDRVVSGGLKKEWRLVEQMSGI